MSQRIRRVAAAINRVLAHRPTRLAGALLCVFIYAYQLNEFDILRIIWMLDHGFLSELLRYSILFSPHVGIIIVLWLAIWRPE